MRRHPWLTAAIALFILCVSTFFAFEWRAEKHWQHYAAEARARGVKLLLADFEQPPIPDEVNFAKLPMWQKGFAGTEEEKPFHLPLLTPKEFQHGNSYPADYEGVPFFTDPFLKRATDWVEWQKYFQVAGFLSEVSDNPLQDVLRALEHYAPEFAQWREWHRRPQCRFAQDPGKDLSLPLPQLTAFMNAEKLLVLRMRAHLALRDSSAAFADFQDGLQAFRAMREEPTMISGLVRISVLSVLLAGVGDGCQDHAWSEEDLRKIETELSGVRVWDDWSFALASERGYFNARMEMWLHSSMREKGEMFLSRMVPGAHASANSAEKGIGSIYPREMVRDSQYRQNCYFDELLARVDSEKQAIHLERATRSFLGLPTDRFEVLRYALILDSQNVYREVETRYIALQTLVDETRLACALELFRVKRGAYPVAFSELVPDFITAVPTDIYAAAPYRYRRMGETSFLLYGVGKNRQDDGGSIAPGVPEKKQLDAVWPHAPAIPAS